MTSLFTISEELLKSLKKITIRSKNCVKVIQEQSSDGKSLEFSVYVAW